MAYVYSHYKKDSQEVFYIGISKSNKEKTRAFDQRKRSLFWKRTANKYGFYVIIVEENISWDQAKDLEKKLIKKYGRVNNNTGSLCNLTDGGEGCLGFVITQEYRKKLSDSKKGKGARFGKDNHFYGKNQSKKSRAKMSNSQKETDKNKGENNFWYGKKMSEERKENLRIMKTGSKHSEETKKKIRSWGAGRPKSDEWKKKVSGKNNGWYGKGHLFSGSKNPRARKCILIETGEVFECLKEACKVNGLSYNTQLAYIKPKHKRHSNRKFNYITKK